MPTWVWALTIGVFLVGLLGLTTHLRLRTLQRNALAAWNQLDREWQRQAEILPFLIGLVDTSPSSEDLRLAHRWVQSEQGLFLTPGQKAWIYQQTGQPALRVFNQASQNRLDPAEIALLRSAWLEADERIDFARQFYNESAEAFNRKLGTGSAKWVARASSLKPLEPFSPRPPQPEFLEILETDRLT